MKIRSSAQTRRTFRSGPSWSWADYAEAESVLDALEDRAPHDQEHTPYAPHLWFIRALCQARNLRFDAASQTLKTLQARFSDAPEPVQVGAHQLRLEIERREQGTLGEIATVMQFVADRLRAADDSEPVRDRQREIVAMLDKLIAEHEQQENQGRGGGQPKSGQRPQSTPRAAKNQSDASAGAGSIGDLHGVPDAEPGEMWGKLPPAERARVLQSIREKYPSRYRQLVEQYYRSLAEEKK